ncbi:MAG: hypothetical protein N2255_04405 [Kiritimatiellae bacterium]|nr:hypothetical protein [Kiritimatiellia bacterium]
MIRILFVGNSHTYVNGLPYQVRELANYLKGPGWCETWMVSSGGKSLAWHAEQPDTVFNIACHPWDFVVLQQRTHPFPPYRELADSVAKLMPHIQNAGANMLFYVTWKRKEAPDTEQEEITEAFRRLVAEVGGCMIPVGPAWAEARRRCLGVELYAPDGRHASPAGTYLAACVFTRFLTGQSVCGLPSRVVANGCVLADLPSEHVRSLQEVADSLPEWNGREKSGE